MSVTNNNQYNLHPERQAIGPVNRRVYLTGITGGIIDQAADNQETMSARQVFMPVYPAGPAVRNTVETTLSTVPHIAISDEGRMSQVAAPQDNPARAEVVELDVYREAREVKMADAYRQLAEAGQSDAISLTDEVTHDQGDYLDAIA